MGAAAAVNDVFLPTQRRHRASRTGRQMVEIEETKRPRCVRGCGRETAACLACRNTFCPDCDRTSQCPWCAGCGLVVDGCRTLILEADRTKPQGIPFTIVWVDQASFDEFCVMLASMPVKDGRTGELLGSDRVEGIRRRGFLSFLAYPDECAEFFRRLGVRTRFVGIYSDRATEE
jgi:hypothetical protein